MARRRPSTVPLKSAGPERRRGLRLRILTGVSRLGVGTAVDVCQSGAAQAGCRKPGRETVVRVVRTASVVPLPVSVCLVLFAYVSVLRAAEAREEIAESDLARTILDSAGVAGWPDYPSGLRRWEADGRLVSRRQLPGAWTWIRASRRWPRRVNICDHGGFLARCRSTRSTGVVCRRSTTSRTSSRARL